MNTFGWESFKTNKSTKGKAAQVRLTFDERSHFAAGASPSPAAKRAESPGKRNAPGLAAARSANHHPQPRKTSQDFIKSTLLIPVPRSSDEEGATSCSSFYLIPPTCTGLPKHNQLCLLPEKPPQHNDGPKKDSDQHER